MTDDRHRRGRRKSKTHARRNPIPDHLRREWDRDKNGDLTPDMLSRFSNRAVWWRCSACGHGWRATVANRSNGNGCPECAKRRRGLTKRRTCASRNPLSPLLVKELHLTRNGSVDPADISAGSDQKYWWQCGACGHDWKATPLARTQGKGCPQCAGPKRVASRRATVVEQNPLHPSIAAQWHPTRNGEHAPEHYSASSRFSAWWLCPVCSHSWQTPVFKRTARHGCPRCKRGLATSYIELVTFHELRQFFDADRRYKAQGGDGKHHEIDVALRSVRIAIEIDGAVWHQDKVEGDRKKTRALLDSGAWDAVIRLRSRDLPTLGDGSIELRTASKKLAEADVWEVLRAVHALRPTEALGAYLEGGELTTLDAARRHYWDMRNGIAARGRSLLDERPDLASEVHPTKNGNLDLRSLSLHSNFKVWWRADCGHEWQAVVYSRATGVGCPECRGTRHAHRRRPLPEHVARELHPTLNGDLKASKLSQGTTRKVWWLGSCGHAWEARVDQRVKGVGCPECRKTDRPASPPPS